MDSSKIFKIDILDPDTGKVIIPSIDRVYAKDTNDAIREFRETFPFKSNWQVRAV